MSSTFIHLVGDKDSPKTNSWLAMCADEEAAQEALETIEGATTTKVVEVKPYRPRRNKR